MTETRDPGREVADKILDDLEQLSLQPTEVARQARRLRAHIVRLREQLVRYAQPCHAHEYIDPSCPDCGWLEEEEG